MKLVESNRRCERLALLVHAGGLALMFALSAMPGPAQVVTPMFELHGSHVTGTGFGRALASLGDIDGDGFNDFLVGAPSDYDGGTNAGAIYLFSGRDGHLIRKQIGSSPGDGFGGAVAAVGDIDGDGVEDMVVGARYAASRVGRGIGYVLSGVNGRRIAEIVSATLGFAETVSSAGDLDGDGVPDVLVGSPQSQRCIYAEMARNGVRRQIEFQAPYGDALGLRATGGNDSSELAVPGGLYLSALRLQAGQLITGRSLFPYYHPYVIVAAAGDVNGDGRDDVGWAGGNQFGVASPGSGSGRDLIVRSVGAPGKVSITALAAGGDLDSDGWPDILVCYVDQFGNNPVVKAISGRDTSTLGQWSWGNQQVVVPAIAIGRDLNHDGVPELIMASLAPGVEKVSVLQFGDALPMGRGQSLMIDKPTLSVDGHPQINTVMRLSATWMQPCCSSVVMMSGVPNVASLLPGFPSLYVDPVSLQSFPVVHNDQQGLQALFAVAVTRVFVGDVTGDGRNDIVGFNEPAGEWYVAVGKPCGFQSPVVWLAGHGYGSVNQFLSDVDGDGKKDAVVCYVPSGDWWVARSSGSGFTSSQKWLTAYGNGSLNQFLTDVDGDRKADAVLCYVPSGDWWVARSDGSKFLPPSKWTTAHGYGSSAQLLADVTGDGLADAVIAYTPSGDWWVAPSTGSAFGPSSLWTSGLATGWALRYLADVSGDGKADAVVVLPTGEWWAAISNATSFATATKWLAPQTGTGAGCADINHDGRADALLENLNWGAITASVAQSGGRFQPSEQPNWSLPIAIPNNSALVGTSYALQAISVGSFDPFGLGSSNGLYLTIRF